MHSTSHFEVLVVGAGCAGLSAAYGLAKAGHSVAVVEAAAYPGAENWSGCVYFCESLAQPELLGPAGVEALAWERRLVQRGAYLCNGQSLLGVSYRDPAAFKNCYTVLRPVFDHHLGLLAQKKGVVLLNQTTAESLIRDEGRVIGVATNRGPLYADLVFLAEGDASHLVSREGYERLPAGQKQPKFLHGIKQILDLPPEAIDRNFGLKPGEGAACEIILRNATLHGKKLKLNMGGFIYTNHASLSIGLVLPADHLHDHFAGDPNLLIEWFENLPDLRPWFKDGVRGVFGAKLIRGGGPKEFPQMVADGLAIGGAASGVGVDFPYPNYTGPATRMGLELVRAVRKIKEAGGRFTQQELAKHYLEPLTRTRYWQDVEFLRDWPGYVESTKVFFDKQVDLLLGSAYVWTRKGGDEKQKWRQFTDLILTQTAGGQIDELKADQKHLQKAMPVPKVFTPPPAPLAVVDGILNTLRDWFGSPRPATQGDLKLHYSVKGDAAGQELPPAVLRNLFTRLKPGLAAAALAIYQNDETPLPKKVRAAFTTLSKQVHLGSFLLAGLQAARHGGRLLALLRGKKVAVPQFDEATHQLFAAATPTPDLTPLVAQAAQKWEDRLGRLGYLTDPRSHIHLRWPVELQATQAVKDAGLWHVCPAHVYEARVNPLGQLQLVVNYENCIKCETCWRTSDLVDWGRDGNHRFIYAVHSPAAAKLIATQQAAGKPALPPRRADVWGDLQKELASELETENVNGAYGHDAAEVAKLQTLVEQLAGKLTEFAAALAAEPRTIDTPRADYLLMLARYARQQVQALKEALDRSPWTASNQATLKKALRRLQDLTAAALPRLGTLVERTEEGRYSWAASEGRHLQQHHLAGLDAILRTLAKRWPSAPSGAAPSPWLKAEAAEQAGTGERATLRARLDDVWGPYLWRDLEQGESLTPPQEAALREIAGRIPALDPQRLAETLHPIQRKLLLAELARRDASLGYRVACHLLARDLTAQFAATSPSLPAWKKAERWASFAHLEDGRIENGQLFGEALFVPAAEDYVLLVGDRLCRFTAADLEPHLEPLGSLGLRGAGLRRLKLDGVPLPPDAVTVDPAAALRLVRTLQSADLIALADGLATLWTERCVGHAASRVQFPGLFHDERSRDTVGKFGAVKKMLAEMGAARLVIETLSHTLSPTGFTEADAARAGLAKAVVAQLLGTAPGSLGYNAGQVFGGTGYSEDDILSKAFRDSAAWRFLGGCNPDLFARHAAGLKAPSTLTGEDELFAIARQRGGLASFMATLDELNAALAARLGQAASPEAAENLAQLDAYLLASKALLFRLHGRLEGALGSEEQEALAQVWFVQLRRWADEWLHRSSSPPREVLHAAGFTSETDYLRFLKTPIKALPADLKVDDPAAKKALGYNTGDFLASPLDLRLPRYVPELIELDATLKASDQRFHQLIQQQFGPPRDGQRYERYLEAAHLPEDADLDFLRQQGFFAMPIPTALGGQGKLKAEYYSLVMQANQYADATISLLIQANTSIGTTPILLARDKDLPKAIKEIKPFVHDETAHASLGLLCAALGQRVEAGDVAGAQTTLKELEPKLEPLLKSGTLKGAVQPFAEAWKAVSRAVAVGDLKKAKPKAAGLQKAWDAAVAASKELFAELNLRLKACDLGLRWIASGQISAFALTEPSAGSDTARVATRAKLCSVPVEETADGVFRFTPAGATEPRFLLDAERLEFKADGAHFAGAKLDFSAYDYATDDPTKLRFFVKDGRKVEFSDIAYLRQRDGRRWYDYWELTGAKMWITNGRMSGIMALYAKTPQGLAGFIVDRHAEGLIVGKDEAKMGQNGSPTNELALQSVRVPRENLLGLEGRGQVNALETLNVGRAGLAMTCVSQLRTLGEFFPASHAPSGGESGAWRKARVEQETFLSESLAYFVIGLFEHPSMQSVRIESAVAKGLVSELLHSSIERTEEALGLFSQTRLHLVEKRKRDARIINLYEGTNEIQRFLIIKELTTEVLPHWKAATPALGGDPLSQRLAEALERFRTRLAAAGQQFGGGLWQNPNLQPTVFLLSEGAMWLLAAHAVAGRLVWLAGRGEQAALPTGQQAFARCLAELDRRLAWFDAEWKDVLAGRYAPVVRAADLLFDAAAHGHATAAAPSSSIDVPLAVMVLLEPSAAAVPQPYVRDGELLEAYWSLTAADEAALEQALRMRDVAPDRVSVTAAVLGGRGLEPLLREVAARGVRPLLLAPPAAAVPPDQAAAALAKALRERKIDLLLGPALAGDAGDGLLAPLIAAELGLPHHGAVASLALRADGKEKTLLLRGEGGKDKLRGLPAAASLLEGIRLRPFTSAGYLEQLAQPVETVAWPEGLGASALVWRSAQSAAKDEAGEAAPTKLDAPAAADLLLDSLGLHADVAPAAADVSWEDAAGPCRIEGAAALAVVACDAEGRLSGSALAAVRAAALQDQRPHVLLLAPADAVAQEKAAQALAAAGAGQIDVLAHAQLGEGDELWARALLEAWPVAAPLPRLLVGERWAELAFPRLRQRLESTGPLALRCKRLEKAGTDLLADTARGQGKLLARATLDLRGASTRWLTVTDDAEIVGAGTVPAGRCVARRWPGALDRLFAQQDFVRLLEELKDAAGVARLADAEFILDVGYGVGNRDGYEAVIEPLEQALRALGVKGLMVGGSRKVTEELHILPADRQIGQSGVSVNPKILIAVGISGAPQHLQYIGPRAVILCFNKDAEAPMMTLNQRQPRPKVFPIVGDLFQTVPAFTQALRAERPAASERPAPAGVA